MLHHVLGRFHNISLCTLMDRNIPEHYGLLWSRRIPTKHRLDSFSSDLLQHSVRLRLRTVILRSATSQAFAAAWVTLSLIRQKSSTKHVQISHRNSYFLAKKTGNLKLLSLFSRTPSQSFNHTTSRQQQHRFVPLTSLNRILIPHGSLHLDLR